MEKLEIINLLLKNKKLDFNVKNFHKYEFSRENHISEGYIKKLTAFQFAIEEEKDDIIHIFITSENLPIDINVKSYFFTYEGNVKENKSKKTLLYLAVENRNIDVLRFLLAKEGIDVNQKSTFITNGQIEEKTPLELAQDKGFTDIIEIMKIK